MPEKKYYWLKLKRDFFKRHDMQIIPFLLALLLILPWTRPYEGRKEK